MATELSPAEILKAAVLAAVESGDWAGVNKLTKVEANKAAELARAENKRLMEVAEKAQAEKVAKTSGARAVLTEWLTKGVANPKLLEALASIESVLPGHIVRIEIVAATGAFLIDPVKAKAPKVGGTRTGGGGRAGTPITVDGIEYPSAAAARDALLPDKAGSNMSRQSITSALGTAGHTVS